MSEPVLYPKTLVFHQDGVLVEANSNITTFWLALSPRAGWVCQPPVQ
jgi:hypothetical protein